MFSENEKISLRQLKRLLVFDLFSVSGLIIPRIASASSGRDGILAIILATLYALIYVWIIMCLAKYTGGNFLNYSSQNVGKIVTFVIGSLYIVKLFACCVFAARLFGEVINETLLEDTDFRIIIILLLCVSAYAASKGFEVRARIAEVLYFIVLVPIFFFLILGLREVDLTNLMPIFTDRTSNIIIGGYEVFLTFSILEILIFVAPLIKVKKSDVTKGRKIHHSVAKAVVLVGFLNILLFIVTVGILGVGEAKQKLWSMVTIIQVIKMPGGFIQRQDAIILGFWMLSIFTILSAFFYYISLISKHIFRVPMQNYLLIPFVLLIFGASAVPLETEQYFYYFEIYMKYVGIPQSVLLPLLVVIVGKIKKPKFNKEVTKSLLIIATVLSSISLTGCSDMTEIEDRNFIQAMGIDLEGEEFTVHYILPDLKALTDQSAEDPEKLALKLKGYNYIQIEEEYHMKYNKRLDFSHLKAIILGSEVANKPEELKEFLTYVENKYEIGRNTLIFVADKKAEDILKLNGDLEGGVGDYLDRLYRINLANTGKEVINVGDLIHGMNNQNPVVGVPVLKAKDKTLKTIGISMFTNNELVYEVRGKEADYIDLAKGFGLNTRIYLSENKEDDLNKLLIENTIKSADEVIEKSIFENAKYVVRLITITRNITLELAHNKPHLSMSIEGIGLFEKGFKDTGLKPQDESAAIIEEVEERCNDIIEKRIINSLDVIMKDSGVDFLNLYRKSSYKNRKIWMKYKDNEKQFVKDISYNIKVDIKIQ